MPKIKSIARTDWDCVHELAVAIANASTANAQLKMHAARMKMLRLLNALTRKYGNHPSILATKADYVERKTYRITLLKKALLAAKNRRDRKNIKLISQDLSAETPAQ